MTTDLRAPPAIRISRPYATEDEYLEHELDTLTRASVTLLGAPPRPEGAVLRFELALSSGQVILRGEGRVTGFKASAVEEVGGLVLRFTRLDMRSKALVDKAAALRERRRPSLQSPGPARSAGSSVAPGAVVLSAAVPPPAFELSAAAAPAPGSQPSVPQPSAPPPAAARAAAVGSSLAPPLAGPPRSAAAGPPPAAPLDEPPAGREALLERLRERAKTADPAMVRRLLAALSPS